MPYQRLKLFLSVLLLSVTSLHVEAGFFDWLSKKASEKESEVKTKLEERKQRKAEEKEKRQAEDKAKAEAQLLIPDDLPSHWQLGFIREPVFESKILVAEAGSAEKENIILIHGLGQNGLRDWLKVIPGLEENYHVVTLDLPGFGHSAKPNGQYSPSNYAEIIHWLKLRYSDQPITVIGHSMGAAIALRYAHRYPMDLKHLVLVDTAGILERTAFIKHNAKIPVDAEKLPPKLQQMAATTMDITGAMVEQMSKGPDPTQFLNQNEAAWNFMFSNVPNANAALSLIMEDFSEPVYNYQGNVSIIWGEKDRVAPLRTGHLLHNKLPNSKLITLSEAAHVPMNSHTEKFMEILNNELALARKSEFVPVNAPDETSQPLGKLTCDRQSERTYTGHYEWVEIKHCHNIRLNNLTAKKIKLTESLVYMDNVRVNGLDYALEATESVVIATNTSFTADIAIRSIGSRFDLAGTSLTGNRMAVDNNKNSRYVMSVSQLNSVTYKGYIHGDFAVKDGTLDWEVWNRQRQNK